MIPPPDNTHLFLHTGNTVAGHILLFCTLHRAGTFGCHTWSGDVVDRMSDGRTTMFAWIPRDHHRRWYQHLGSGYSHLVLSSLNEDGKGKSLLDFLISIFELVPPSSFGR